MRQKINLTDLRNEQVFPNNNYRFSRINKVDNQIVLERDFIGENSLHYYLEPSNKEVIVSNSIREIKEYLEENSKQFFWEHVRAVSNNKKVIINNNNFYDATPEISELVKPLQERSPPNINFKNITKIGEHLRSNLENSIEERLDTIKDEKVGVLLSGGLDSITISYLLRQQKENINAFTLKVNEDDSDIVKSRMVAQQLQIPLTEVRLSRKNNNISLNIEEYNASRELVNEYFLTSFKIDDVVKNTLLLAENPKKDNLFCSIAMNLIGNAVKHKKINTVFCGEGPNEMINDYGFIPGNEGYAGLDINDTYFRQALTFGLKESDLQLGRGGLAKHALSRMGKIFAKYNIRLESPYFKAEIANIMTRIPYEVINYSTIKPEIAKAVLGINGQKILGNLNNISKKKFQDGSGLSKLFTDYNQTKLIQMFMDIYGVNKNTYK